MFDAEQIAHESMIAAINIAKKAAHNNVKVLGSIAPLEDCYKPQQKHSNTKEMLVL